jgi:hypothetical protein
MLLHDPLNKWARTRSSVLIVLGFRSPKRPFETHFLVNPGLLRNKWLERRSWENPLRGTIRTPERSEQWGYTKASENNMFRMTKETFEMLVDGYCENR